MALFAGGLFWLIRAALALSARAALVWPLKGAAALLSLAPAAAYTAFSGAEIATLRAFIMTSIVLVAVALGRNAITWRNIAIAAMVVLLDTQRPLSGRASKCPSPRSPCWLPGTIGHAISGRGCPPRHWTAPFVACST